MTHEPGKIDQVSKNILEKSEYKCSLETMEEIEMETECVIIKPDHCPSYHVILIEEFVRSNLFGDFKNPYTRNKVEFDKNDHEKITNLRIQYIKSLKNIPHELFSRFLRILKIMKEKNVFICLFQEITRIFTILLEALPVFDRMDEALGYYDDSVHKVVKNLEKKIELTLNEFEKALDDSIFINKMMNELDFYTLPHSIKEPISYFFSTMIDLLQVFEEKRTVFEHSGSILNIFYLLDEIQNIVLTHYEKIVSNEELEEQFMALMCKADFMIGDLFIES